jgi:hypothetical protein
MRTRALPLMAAVLSTSVFVGHGRADDLEATWRRDYPAAAKRLEGFTQRFLCKGTLTRRSYAGKTIVTKEITIARSGDKKLLVRDKRFIEGTSREFQGDVLSLTPRHAFRLTRQMASQPYVVEAFVEPENWPTLELQFKVLSDEYIQSAYKFSRKTLLEMLDDPTFVLKSISRVDKGPERYVRVDYAMGEGDTAESGKVLLDPRREWAIREFDVKKMVALSADKVVQERTQHGEIGYADLSGGVIFPNTIHVVRRTPKPDAYEEIKLDFKEIQIGDVPDNRFALTAFGLPDIPLRPVPAPSFLSLRNPVLWASLVVAIAAFALQHLLKTRLKRSPA